MNCDQAKALINAYIDQSLSAGDVVALESHCTVCDECKHEVDVLLRQKQLLASLPAVELDAVVKKRLFDTAVKQADADLVETKATSMPSVVYRFAAAAMISAIALFAAMPYISTPEGEDKYMVLVSDQVQTITVAIESEQAIDMVKMHVELSDNLELKGFGSKRQVNWDAGLKKGVNVISLPIIGIAQGEGDITTRVQINGNEKVMHIKTQYRQPGNVYYGPVEVMQG
jgi:hypothetical protein